MLDWITVRLNDIAGYVDQTLDFGLTILAEWVTWLYKAVVFVWDVLKQFGKWVIFGAKLIKGGIIRSIKALLHLKPSSVWAAIKRGWDGLKRLHAWFKKWVLDPIDRQRRAIMDIYNRFFAPVIRVIDRFRRVVRVIALFNRRLAARLDARLMALEDKILWPITYSLRRLNSLTSYMTAIITAGGLLDRAVQLESLRRDAGLVWEVLINPRGAISPDPTRIARRPLAATVADFQQFVDSDSGPVADVAESAAERFEEFTALLG